MENDEQLCYSVPCVDALNVVVVFRLKLFRDGYNGLHAFLVRENICLNGLMLLARGIHRPEIRAKVVLRHQTLILAEPRLTHASFTVEARRQLLQLLLPARRKRKENLTFNNTGDNNDKKASLAQLRSNQKYEQNARKIIPIDCEPEL